MTTHDKQKDFKDERVRRYSEQEFSPLDVAIVRECFLEVVLNDQSMASIACLGSHLEELAVGFLRSEGLITGMDDLRKVETVAEEMKVCVYTKEDRSPVLNRRPSITSSGARGQMAGAPAITQLISGEVICSPERISHLMDSMVEKAQIHELTRGTHCAALAGGEGIAVLREDIGRHNCLDMLSGYCLLNGVDGSDKILLRTGRVSSEIIRKVWTLGTKLVASLSVPTTAALAMAQSSGITLIGAVRNGSMTIYSHGERIGDS
jgi:FdhD protein